MSVESAVDEQGTSEVRAEDLQRELRDLRHGLGCTPERLARKPVLLKTLRRRLRSQQGTPPPKACAEELKAMIQNLRNPKHREHLLVAFGFNDQFKEGNTSKRREAYLAYLDEYQYSDPLAGEIYSAGGRTPQQREDAGILALVALLVSEDSDERQSDSSFSAPSSDDGFRIESQENWYTFGPNRVLESMFVTSNLVALESGYPLLLLGHEYYEDGRSGALDFIPGFGFECEGNLHFSNGVAYQKLRAKNYVEVGNPYSSTHKIIVNSDRPVRPKIMISPIHDRSWTSQHFQFQKDEVPEELWGFKNLSYMHTSDPGKMRQRLIAKGGSGYAYVRWEGLRAGHCSGVTFDFPK